SYGYEQFEISNFALPKHYAVHNTNYWKKKHYLGLGPSAHSFNGNSRQWNIANNALYIQALQKYQPAFEIEQLSAKDNWNEYIMTSIRTIWGIDTYYLKTHFPESFIAHLEDQLHHLHKEWLIIS